MSVPREKIQRASTESLVKARRMAERRREWGTARLIVLELWSRAGEPMKGREG